MEKQIELELPASAVQYILNLLAERPFKEVSDLIPLIMRQANAQLQPTPVKPENPAEAP